MIQIRPLAQKDLGEVAALHCSAFTKSALTRLGLEAVRRYYGWQLNGPHDCDAFGALQEGKLVGFCFGGVFRGALSGFVRANRGFLIKRLCFHPWLLFDPWIRARLGTAVRVVWWHIRPARVASSPVSVTKHSYSILSIAVKPEVQGQGVGRILMTASEHKARTGGFHQMHLSVHPDNQVAVRFYERLGWEKVVEKEGWTGKMIRILTPLSHT